MLAKFKFFPIFFVCFFGALIVPFFFPFCRFLFFAPFLIVSIYQKTLWSSLWRATGIGILDDLLSTTIFGISSCNYVIVCALLYRVKRHFFEDNPSTILIMTSLFSFLSIIVKTMFGKILGHSFPITLGFITTDILIIPLLEGIYAYIVFILPYQLYKYVKRFILIQRVK